MPIQPKNIVEEMETSYLDYAMSVIVARALPDVRDGLKPVHRRILVTLNDLHLTHSAKHRKSAKICGDVSGNYHPHGEAIVYPSMVRLAQDFAMRYPLVDGQGNFGSIDGDNAAAMRYTEARMSKIAEEMLRDIEKKTVDYVDNYDGTRQEPVVLPSRIPQLILNGTLGIAVGMATNIPPHNLGEVCDGIVALIERITPGVSDYSSLQSEITIPELMQYIKGPDFPTGAIIYSGQGLIDAYATGRGKVIIRGEAEIQDDQKGQRIVISSIPYQVNKAELVSKIADLVNNKKIVGITDIRDESDRQGIRIVIDLKRGSFPKKILNAIYSQTALQVSYHFNMLALVDGIEPQVLNLKEILLEFVKFRFHVVARRSEFELSQAKERLHILEGFLKALDIIDAVVATIRTSKTREEAQSSLIKKFAFSEKQSNAILDLRLSSLVGLERQRLEEEYRQKREYIAYLEDLLASPAKILGVIKDETLAIKKEFSDPRLSEIRMEEITSFRAEDLVPEEEVLLSLTKTGYIKRMPLSAYKNQGRGGKGVVGMSTKEEDEIKEIIVANTHDTLLFFTNQGKVFRSKVYEIPAVARQSKGVAVQNIINISPEERVTAMLNIGREINEEAGEIYLVMATLNGLVKKTPILSYKNIRSTGIVTFNLAEDDQLLWVKLCRPGDFIIETTQNGQCIIYSESDIRPTGRAAGGVRGIRLRGGDQVISMNTITAEDMTNKEILVVLEKGLGKRTKLTLFDVQKRGGIGIKAANVTDKTGKMVDATVIDEENKGSVILMSKDGLVIKMKISNVKLLGRVTQGVTLMRLNFDDRVATVAVVPEE